MMMIHNPFAMAMGDSEEMRKAIQLLDEVKESIINAYKIKTGQSRTKLSHLMDSETWMNAWKAKELGFCDEVMFAEGDQPDTKNVSGFSYARKTAAACLMNRLVASVPKAEPEKAPANETRVSTAAAENRLLKTKYL
jgi:ATP-dependent Clp protease protease subunit